MGLGSEPTWDFQLHQGASLGLGLLIRTMGDSPRHLLGESEDRGGRTHEGAAQRWPCPAPVLFLLLFHSSLKPSWAEAPGGTQKGAAGRNHGPMKLLTPLSQGGRAGGVRSASSDLHPDPSPVAGGPPWAASFIASQSAGCEIEACVFKAKACTQLAHRAAAGPCAHRQRPESCILRQNITNGSYFCARLTEEGKSNHFFVTVKPSCAPTCRCDPGGPQVSSAGRQGVELDGL